MALSRIAETRRRRRLRRRTPSRATRRRFSASEPRAAVVAFTKMIRDRLVKFEREIERLLFPVLDELVPSPGAQSTPDEPDARVRVDARIPSSVLARLSALELRLIEIFDERELEDALEVIGQRISTKNRNELRRVVGISIRDADPGVAAHLEEFRAINVSRIKSLAGRELVEITQILERSEATGARVEVLREGIQKRFGVTRSRAALLARDQTLSLNAQIARTRQQNLGIERYVWTTSGDERVRDEHEALEGRIFRWDTPPAEGHPGEPIQCRCTAFPLLPELS